MNKEYYQAHRTEIRERQNAARRAKKAAMSPDELREYLAKENERRRERSRQSYYRHRDEIRAKSAARWAAMTPDERERHRVRKRVHNRKCVTGWTAEEFERAWLLQEGLCAICGTSMLRYVGKPHNRVVCADHDHATGQIRALLCSFCNQGIARFRDNPRLLRSAADYVETDFKAMRLREQEVMGG